MQTISSTFSRRKRGQPEWRRGSVLVLAAFMIAIIFAMTAFAVDLGYLSTTKTQLQSASDASALAAALELSSGLGTGPSKTPGQVASDGNAAAVAVAQLHRNGDRSSTYVSSTRDIRYGQLTWNSFSGTWTKTYGSAPYNLVEVTVRRDQTASIMGDGRVPLMFGRTMGVNDAAVVETSAAGLMPGVGVQITSGSSSTIGVLPIALDEPSWNALIGGSGPDKYKYDSLTGGISSGSDGVLEVDLYPYGKSDLPPGNRGTVDLGSSSNSTNDLKRQILNGLNATDLSYFGGSISTANGSISLNGDTGISAGIKDDLATIKGQPRLIPLFSQVTAPGNNAVYTITRFVPVRILSVKLTGNPKSVIVQPAPFSSPLVVAGHVAVTSDSYYTSPRLVE